MPTHASSIQSLRRVFQQGFLVQDIAEPLISFDGETSALLVKQTMEAKSLEVAGIRKDGTVVGYVNRVDLQDGECIGAFRPFDKVQIVFDSMQLGDLVLRLRDTQRLFVSILGRVGGIVSRSDLQKPPVRMWLFGIITLLEMRFTRQIEEFLPDDQWRSFLSEGRVQKAESLLVERSRRGHAVNLLDCLQLADKATIVSRNPQLREITQFESKKQFESVVGDLQNLRNNLAHSQDIIAQDWDVIITMAESLNFVLEREEEISTRIDS